MSETKHSKKQQTEQRKIIKSYQTILALAVSLISVVLIATSIDQLELQPGKKAIFSQKEGTLEQIQEEPLVEKTPEFNPPYWFIYFLYLPFIYIVYRILKRLEWAPIKDKSWKLYLFILAAVFLLIFLIGLGLDFLNSATIDLVSDNSFRDPEVYRDPVFKNYYFHLFLVLFLLILSGLLLAGVKMIGLVLNKSNDEADLPEQVIVEIKKTAEEINAGLSARDTIIRCYSNMCHLLAVHQDINRKESMTPQEFSENLANLGFKSKYVIQLTRLYERARFSNSEFTMEQTDQALSSLHKIIDQYQVNDAG